MQFAKITEQRSLPLPTVIIRLYQGMPTWRSSEKRYDILCGFPDGAFKRDYGLGGSLRDEKKETVHRTLQHLEKIWDEYDVYERIEDKHTYAKTKWEIEEEEDL